MQRILAVVSRVLLIAFAVASIGCSSSTAPTGPELGETFQLAYGQSVTLQNESVTIRFKALDEDSRCPEGAVCIWAGNARVVIEVAHTGLLLNTLDGPGSGSYAGYKVQLLAVGPYPRLGEQPGVKDYFVTLVVQRG